MTINKAFKDVYCKLLAEEGYQYCAKLQRFVKVVNKELIYFIGYKKVPAWIKGNKGFTIMAGIISVYFYKSAEWTTGYTEDKLFKWSFDYTGKEICMFSPTREYGMGFEYNQENMIELVEKSAEITKKLVLPVFAEVTDLISYVKYAKKYIVRVLGGCNKFLGKSDDWFCWLKKMNSIRSRAEEVVPHDLIYFF